MTLAHAQEEVSGVHLAGGNGGEERDPEGYPAPGTQAGSQISHTWTGLWGVAGPAGSPTIGSHSRHAISPLDADQTGQPGSSWTPSARPRFGIVAPPGISLKALPPRSEEERVWMQSTCTEATRLHPSPCVAPFFV